jgi:hypothetical protein
MKTPAFIGLSILAISSLGMTQRKSSPVDEQSITIHGAKLYLGMSKNEVADKLANVPELEIQSPKLWMIGTRTQSWPDSIEFKDDKVVFASRSWRENGLDPVQALFGVASSMNHEGLTDCTLSTNTLSHPDDITQRIFITCGNKTIAVVRMLIGEHKYEQVVEQFGKSSD